MSDAQPEQFKFTATGNSMNLAGIADGDEICAHRRRRAKSGDIVVVRIGEEDLTTKRLQVGDFNAWLAPDSDDDNWHPLRLDDDIHIMGIVEGKMHPVRGFMRLKPQGKKPVILRPNEMPPAPPRKGIARTFQFVPPPAGPRQAYSKSIAVQPSIAFEMTWHRYAGEAGNYGDINPRSTEKVRVPTFCADLSDYFVTAASDSMSVRGVRRGDNVFVKRLDPRKFWSGLIVLVDLGEWGATIGEIHDDGSRRYLRSNQGLPYKQEMNVEIINADILGLVFMVTRG